MWKKWNIKVGKTDGYFIKKIKVGNIKVILIVIMMIMSFLLRNLLMMQINVGRIIKDKENNILFFLNILVCFGNVIIVIMYQEVFLILLVNIKIIYNLHPI